MNDFEQDALEAPDAQGEALPMTEIFNGIAASSLGQNIIVWTRVQIDKKGGKKKYVAHPIRGTIKEINADKSRAVVGINAASIAEGTAGTAYAGREMLYEFPRAHTDYLKIVYQPQVQVTGDMIAQFVRAQATANDAKNDRPARGAKTRANERINSWVGKNGDAGSENDSGPEVVSDTSDDTSATTTTDSDDDSDWEDAAPHKSHKKKSQKKKKKKQEKIARSAFHFRTTRVLQNPSWWSKALRNGSSIEELRSALRARYASEGGSGFTPYLVEKLCRLLVDWQKGADEKVAQTVVEILERTKVYSEYGADAAARFSDELEKNNADRRYKGALKEAQKTQRGSRRDTKKPTAWTPTPATTPAPRATQHPSNGIYVSASQWAGLSAEERAQVKSLRAKLK